MKSLQKILRQKNISYDLFFNLWSNVNPNFYYFTKSDVFGCLVVPKDKTPFLIVPTMEENKARKTGIRAIVYKESLFKEIKKHIGRKDRIGIDKATIKLTVYNKLKITLKGKKLIDTSKISEDLRKIKNKEEIKLTKRACSITDHIFKEIIKNFRKFKTESDIDKFIRIKIIENNCKPSFDPIIASGGNAALPHHSTSNSKLKKGFCIIDFGVNYQGCCSDMTRTVYIGRPTIKEIKTYAQVLSANLKGINCIKHNMKCSDVHNTTKKELKSLKKYLNHSVGHGIGVEVHESPHIGEKSKEKIENGMIFTIEPGIYIKNKLGIRIEDDILFDSKAIVLTKSSKNLIII